MNHYNRLFEVHVPHQIKCTSFVCVFLEGHNMSEVMVCLLSCNHAYNINHHDIISDDMAVRII